MGSLRSSMCKENIETNLRQLAFQAKPEYSKKHTSLVPSIQSEKWPAVSGEWLQSLLTDC
jgi:hypothetical protein